MKIKLGKQKYKAVKEGQYGAYNLYIWEFTRLDTGESLTGSVNGNDDWKTGGTYDVKAIETYINKKGETGYNIKTFTKKEIDAIALATGQIASTPALVHSEGSNIVAIANIETSLAKLESNMSKLSYVLKDICNALNAECNLTKVIDAEDIPF